MRVPSKLLLAAVAVACTLSAMMLNADPVAAASNGNGVIAFVRNGDVWTIDPESGAQRELTAEVPPPTFQAGPLSWSPDGSRLLYSTEVLDTPPYGQFRSVPMVMSADGSSKHALVDDPSQDWVPECWLGPDLVALRRLLPENLLSTDFYLVRSDGSGLRRLTPAGFDPVTHAIQAEGVCSPVAGLLFFISYDPMSSAVETYSLSTDGKLRLLPSDAGLQSVSPDPDGYRLAWMRHDGLSVTAIDGTSRTKIADIGNGWTSYYSEVGTAQWSPDGSEIAFPSVQPLCCSDEDPSYESSVRVVSASGTGGRALTPGTGERANPLAWSPDGTKILFSSDRGGVWPITPPNVFVMNTDGSCETNLFTYQVGVPDVAEGVAWQPAPAKPVEGPMVCADVGIAGEQFGPAVGLGDGTPYPVIVSNGGNLPAYDVRLVLSDLTDLQTLSISTAQGSCNASSCDLGKLAPGATTQVTLKLVSTNSAFPSSVQGSFTARVSSSGSNSDDTNDSLRVFMQAYGCPLGTYGPDRFSGTTGDDSYCGLGGDDKIFGRAGNDQLAGELGADLIDGGPGHDALEGGSGNDMIIAQDGQRDDVDCGDSEGDVAIVDGQDSVGRCEHVAVPRIRCRSYTSVGGGEVLVGTARSDALCGLFGNDRILGRGGNDAIDGGGGADTIDGGTGRDRIYGGRGPDYVLTRDGAKDTIDCGRGKDTAVVDQFDRVATSCEHVLRRRP